MKVIYCDLSIASKWTFTVVWGFNHDLSLKQFAIALLALHQLEMCSNLSVSKQENPTLWQREPWWFSVPDHFGWVPKLSLPLVRNCSPTESCESIKKEKKHPRRTCNIKKHVSRKYRTVPRVTTAVHLECHLLVTYLPPKSDSGCVFMFDFVLTITQFERSCGPSEHAHRF